MTTNLTAVLAEAWGISLELAVCDQCDTRFFMTEGEAVVCPFCWTGTLRLVQASAEALPLTTPPELMGGWLIEGEKLKRSYTRFFDSVKYKPDDLTPHNLLTRTRREYLPAWLVDSDVEAQWGAKVGYLYDVESFKSTYKGGQWVEQRVVEQKMDWAERVGTLVKHFPNTQTRALRQHKHLLESIGGYPRKPIPYIASGLDGALIRLPDIAPQESYEEAVLQMKGIAREQCKQAAEGDKIEGYSWQPAVNNQNWTLLLVPTYVSYYMDEDGKPRRVRVHGETGKVAGVRRQSLRRAWQNFWIRQIWTAAAVLIGLGLALGIDTELTPRLIFFTIGAVFALILLADSYKYMVQFARNFNQRQSDLET